MSSAAVDQIGMYSTADLHMHNSFSACLHALKRHDQSGAEPSNKFTESNPTRPFPCSDRTGGGWWAILAVLAKSQHLSVSCLLLQDVTDT